MKKLILFYTDKNDKLKNKEITSDKDLVKILNNINNCPQWYTDETGRKLSNDETFKFVETLK